MTPAQIWSEWIRRIEHALAHPELYPRPKVIHGLPTDEEVLAWFAHDRVQGEAALARARRFLDEAVRSDAPALRQLEVSRAAADLVRSTPLTIDQAMAVVQTHGLDVAPDRAVDLAAALAPPTSEGDPDAETA